MPPDPFPDDEKIETTVRRLRRDGHSRTTVVQLLLDRLDVSLAEAKELLHAVDTWGEARTTAGPNSSVEASTSSPDPPPPAPG